MRFWRNLGIKRGCIFFGRRVRSLKKYLRELLEHVGKKIREAKTLFEVKMATSVKDNKNYFYKYVNGKRKAKSSLCSLLMREKNQELQMRRK